MSNNDMDININKVVMADESLGPEEKRSNIPEVEDQSTNIPKEELFKQNIQIGESGENIDDRAVNLNERDDASKAASPDNSNDSVIPNSDSTSISDDNNNSVIQQGSNAANSAGDASSQSNSASSNSNLFSSKEDITSNVSESPVNSTVNTFSNGTNAKVVSSTSANISSGDKTISDSEASTPSLVVEDSVGDEDTAIELNIDAALTDTDGSETLAIEIQNIPEGAVLSDGMNSFTANSSENTVDITGWDIDSLSITPVANSDADFDLVVQATSTEQSNSDVSSVSATLNVVVNSVNDAPDAINLQGNSVSENSEGVVIGTLSTSDVDSGDSHSYSVSDDRFEVVDGKLQLKDGISLNYENAQTVEIEVTSTDSQGASIAETFTVNVQDVNEGPTGISMEGGTVKETVSSGGTIDNANDPSGSVVATLSTNDEDVGDSHTYEIIGGASDKFEIVGNEVRVKEGASIDYESAQSHEIEIRVTDSAGNTYDQTLAINVEDFVGSYTASSSGGFARGTSEEDSMQGGSGSDYLYGMEGNDQLSGGEGFDRLDGGAGDDIVDGGGGTDYILETGDGDDVLIGGEGNDIVADLGTGDDELLGGAGNDLMLGGKGADVIDGGAGNDIAYYSTSNEGVTIVLGEEDVVTTATGGDAEGDQLVNVEGLFGSSGDDNLTGNSGDNSLYGYLGDDVIDGGAGNDILNGQWGNDQLSGGDGADLVYGGAGNDTLNDGAGDDRMYGGNGDDIVIGSSGDDQLYGNNGNDIIVDWSGNNHIDGGAGNDLLVSVSGDDRLVGGSGDDRIYGLAGNDQLEGGAGNDLLNGGAGDDTFMVGEGSDNVYGGGGSDLFILDALDGNDTFHGGNGGGWSDSIDINVSPEDTGDSDNPWTIEVNGEQVEFELADGGIDVGPDAAGVISFANGTEVSFDGIETIQW